jgi:Zn-finger nucleic acid-binding protein
MPLLVSPIDGTTPMQQIVRNGIEIDRCPVSGGVWLDKGELEKLLNAMQDAIQEDRQEYNQFRQSPQGHAHTPQAHHHPAPQHQALPGYGRPAYRDDDYDDYYRHKYGKKSKIKSIFDLFD